MGICNFVRREWEYMYGYSSGLNGKGFSLLASDATVLQCNRGTAVRCRRGPAALLR